MKKIQSLFKRNYDGNRLVYNEVVPGSEWVLNGEGIATRKYDGTCCMIKDGEIYARYDIKKGRNKPDGFLPAQDPDPITGHWPGWVKCDRNNKAHKYYFEALENFQNNKGSYNIENGTYELCGPKVQGNPEGYDKHILIPHSLAEQYPNCPRDFDELKHWFMGRDIEGIVWHHPDGRMVKIKKKDFGMKRTD